MQHITIFVHAAYHSIRGSHIITCLLFSYRVNSISSKCPNCNQKVSLFQLPESFRYVRCRSCGKRLVLSKGFMRDRGTLLQILFVPWLFITFFGDNFLTNSMVYSLKLIISTIMLLISLTLLWSIFFSASYEPLSEKYSNACSRTQQSCAADASVMRHRK